MEHKRYFDAKTTDVTRNERFLLIPNFTEFACEAIKKLLDAENPYMIHVFIVFEKAPGIIDLGQNIYDIDADKRLYIGTIIDTMPSVKGGCVIIKTLKPIHDIVDRLNFDMVDFSVIIDSEPYDKNDIIIKIHLFDPEVCRCFNSGRTEFRFVYDKGEPFWM